MGHDDQGTGRTVTADEFRDDPRGVIAQAYEHGSVTVESDDPADYVRFVTQTYDIDFE